MIDKNVKEISDSEADALLDSLNLDAITDTDSEDVGSKEVENAVSTEEVLTTKNETDIIDEAEKSLNEEDSISDDALDILNELQDEEGSESKGVTRKVLKELADSGEISLFDDLENIDDYTDDDIKELITANLKNQTEGAVAEFANEYREGFFKALPPELQYAAKYVAEGGTDLRSVFKMLSKDADLKSLDPQKETDQEEIVRQYLTETGFGTPEEIQDEVNFYKDHDGLKDKALKFKPKLDVKEQAKIEAKVEAARKRKEASKESMKMFIDNVYNEISTGDIAGIKIPKDKQMELFDGLVKAEHRTSNGSEATKLVHLIDKYQSVEPNPKLLAEALWLLSNPDEYRASQQQLGSNETTEKTVRELKSLEQKKVNTSNVANKSNASSARPKQKKTMSRTIFSR